MRIAVDAMGSDGAPDIEVEGAVQASREENTEVLLVGDESVLTPKLEAHSKIGDIRIVHASQAIGMDESPALAVRQKKDASLLVATRLVKRGEADAVVSAGNTGAVMVAARAVLGPLRGVTRSAISQCFPTATGEVVLLDLGANVDCTSRQLCEFAEMGIAYSHYALGVESPRVALLNIGEEHQKGTQVAREAHQVLSQTPHVNFTGNVEPRTLLAGDADVVVCDGFIGNLVLKTCEAAAEFMVNVMREQFESSSMNKLGAMIASKALRQFKMRIDPNEQAGAPLLGINGIAIILHGSCSSKGVANGINGARVAFENRLNEHIHENIEMLRGAESGLGTSVLPNGNGGGREQTG